MTGKQLKNSILQWAIQGKLVPQDPNEEPASILLEKIRAEKAQLIKEGKIKKDKNESIIYRGEDNSYYEKMADGTIKCIDDEIPFEIPESWEWCRINNLFLHASGKQQSSSNKKGGTPQQYITTSNLYWNRFVLDTLKVMNFTDEEIKTCSATKGDLLVCEGGAGYGRSAIWNYDYDICLQNHVHRLRPFIDGLCEYVYYFIYLLKESNRLISVGTAMPGLSANRLKSLLLPLPPKNEQLRITEKLKALEPLIERYSKSQENLDLLSVGIKDLLRKSILQEAIQGRLVPQIESEGDASALLQQVELEKQKLVKEGKLKKKDLVSSTIFRGDDNKYYEKIDTQTSDISEEIPFDVPSSWTWCRLGTLISAKSGLSYSKDHLDVKSEDTTRVLRGGNILEGKWMLKDDDVIIASEFVKSDLLLKKGYYITPAVTSWENMGKTALIETNQNNIVVGGFVLMLCPYLYNETLSRFLYYLFQTVYFKQYCQSITNKSGQAFYNLSRAKLIQMPVPLPSLSEMDRISNKLNDVLSSIMSR